MHVCMSLMNINDVLGSYAMMVCCQSSSRSCFCLICGNKGKTLQTLPQISYFYVQEPFGRTQIEKKWEYILIFIIL